jgi:DNA-binding CsgD family transcriptional regulator
MRKLTKPADSNKPLVIHSSSIKKAELIYRAIYHPLRIKIVSIVLKAGKLNVSKLNKRLKEDSSLISQQLKILRDANILVTQREGKQVLYTVDNNQVDKIQQSIQKISLIPASKPIAISPKELKALKERIAKPKKSTFSKNEMVIIKLICDQWTSEEIGEKLELSKRTVEDYRRRIIQKMNMKNTAGLVMYAIKNGMVKL